MTQVEESEYEVPQTSNRWRVIIWVRKWLRWNRKPKVYLLVRKEDPSGISGTGVIAQAVEWSDGSGVLHWPENPAEEKPETTTVFASFKDIRKLHGHGDKTVLVKIS